MDPVANPDAQGQNTEAVSDGQSNNQQQPQNEAVAGIEKRINELTARYHEADRTNQQLMSTIAEQQSVIAQMQSRPAQQAPVQEEALDPSNPEHLPRIVERAIRQATAPLQSQIQQLSGQMVGNKVSSEMELVNAKLQKLNNPAVAGRVNQLINTWKQSGHFQAGAATPKDAYLIAMGELADGQFGQVQQNQQARQDFNNGGQPLVGGAGHRQQVQQHQQQNGNGIEQQLANADLENMSYAEVNKLINDVENKYSNGVPLGR